MIYFTEIWEVLVGEHHRHKTIVCSMYIFHEVIKGIAPESAGQFYLLLELLHSIAG